jgi:hypothetical protein
MLLRVITWVGETMNCMGLQLSAAREIYSSSIWMRAT